MPSFTSKTTRMGNSIYLLIPVDTIEKNNITEGEYFHAEIKRLVPQEATDE